MSLHKFLHNRGYDEVPIKPIDRLEPLRKDDNKRRKTFKNFPKNAQADIEELLTDGFFYVGDGENDRVQCAFCGGILKNWHKGDNVNAEHRRIFNRCPKAKDSFQFLNHGESHLANFSNITLVDGNSSRLHDSDLEDDAAPQDSRSSSLHDSKLSTDAAKTCDKPRHPSYSLKMARLNSFKNWPESMKQKPDDLAEAGLFYTGEADRTLCYQCGGALVEWEPDDVPASEHDHWFPECLLAVERKKSQN